LRNPRTKENGWLPLDFEEVVVPPAAVVLEDEAKLEVKAEDLFVLAGETLAEEEEGEAPPEGKGGKTVSRCG
jgi:hypothetical protein